MSHELEAIREMLKGIKYMIASALSNTTKVYDGVVMSEDKNGKWNIKYNGEEHSIKLYGTGTPELKSIVKVTVPQGNQSLAFFTLKAGESKIKKATNKILGGILAPDKTAEQTEPVGIDANGHLFVKPGGVPPGNVKQFTASSKNGKVQLNCILPDDTVIDGILLATVAGAKIVRRTDRYPNTENDGILVKDLKESGSFIDIKTDTGVRYYYAAYPYTDQGVYNRNSVNRLEYTPRLREYLYGYDIKLADSNPSTRVSYPFDVDNAGFNPAKMVFGNPGHFDYGSWPSNPGEKFMPKPVMLGYDGKVKEWLDPADYSRQTNGQPSHVADADFPGNAMMQWPKIYTKRWEENGVYHFRCSEQKVEPDWDCWCNYDKNDKEIPYFYTAIYFGCEVSGKLRSLSGKSGTASQTADTEISRAKKNGADWFTELLVDRLLIADLLVMLAKTTDSQKAYGYGRSKSGGIESSGSMDKWGIFWGSSDKISGVKVFGMEDYWGNIWRRIAGWISANGSQKIKLTRGRHDGSTVTDYNTTGDGYLSADAPDFIGSSGGYIGKMKTTPYGRVPYAATGSSTAYESDGLWYSNSGVMFASVGGLYNNDLLNGLFSSLLILPPSSAGLDRGSAISCKPTLEV